MFLLSAQCQSHHHDLELLDEITNLHFKGKLPEAVQGDRWNALIHSFRQCKGMSYVPSSVHSFIRWNKRNPIADDISWTMVAKASKTLTTPDVSQGTCSFGTDAKGDSTDTPKKSMKRKEITPQKEHKAKVSKTHSFPNTNRVEPDVDIHSLMPCGLAWHQNSCAYNAILSIVHAMWANNKDKCTQIFNGSNNEILVNLALNFMKHASEIKTLESTRDDMRHFLHQLAPHYFGWAQFTSFPLIAKYMFT